MTSAEKQNHTNRLTDIARQLNLFISSLKGQRSGEITVAKTLKESPVEYLTSHLPDNFPKALFDETDFAWLES
jgi:F0F1-type ATP synthase delta subunit